MKLTKALWSEFWQEQTIVFKSLQLLLYPTYNGQLQLFSLKAQKIKDDKIRKDYYRRTIASIQDKIERREKHRYSIITLLTVTFGIMLICVILSLISIPLAQISYWTSLTTFLVFLFLFGKYLILELGLTTQELRMFLDYVQKKIHGKSYNKQPIPVISDEVFAVFNGTKNELAAWFHLMPLTINNKSRFNDTMEQFFRIKDKPVIDLNAEISRFGKYKISEVNKTTANKIVERIKEVVGE